MMIEQLRLLVVIWVLGETGRSRSLALLIPLLFAASIQEKRQR